MKFRDEKQKRNSQIFAFKRMKEKTASLESNRHRSEIILSAVKTMLSFPGRVIATSFETWTRNWYKFQYSSREKNPQTPKEKKRLQIQPVLQPISAWEVANETWIKLVVFLISLSLQLFIQNWTQAWFICSNDTNGFLAAIQGKTVIRTFKNWWFHLPSLKKANSTYFTWGYFLFDQPFSLWLFFLANKLHFRNVICIKLFFLFGWPFWLEIQVPFRVKICSMQLLTGKVGSKPQNIPCTSHHPWAKGFQLGYTVILWWEIY